MRSQKIQNSRRSAIKTLSTFAAAATLSPFQTMKAAEDKQQYSNEDIPPPKIRKIATEEAFNIPEIAEAIRDITRKGGNNLDLMVLKQIYDPQPASAPAPVSVSNRDAATQGLLQKLLDIETIRLADMDANGVDMHVLSMTMPGVQILPREQAVRLSTLANDRLSEAVRRHPKRFTGLACFAPQDVAGAVKEMERSINNLHLNGFILNSHTENEYLDNEKFWPVLEAAEALNSPLYLHPRAPSDGMATPFRDYRLEGAVWGYGVETATHVLRMIFGGVFDRFPKLQVVIGHMGEALPFWLWRLDFMGAPGARAGRKNSLKPSEYFKRNIYITTSGVEDPLALRFCIDKLGVDRIMWAIDYPYQPSGPAANFIETAPMTQSEREMIAYKNAEKVFSIKG